MHGPDDRSTNATHNKDTIHMKRVDIGYVRLELTVHTGLEGPDNMRGGDIPRGMQPITKFKLNAQISVRY